MISRTYLNSNWLDMKTCILVKTDSGETKVIPQNKVRKHKKKKCIKIDKSLNIRSIGQSLPLLVMKSNNRYEFINKIYKPG